MSKVFLLDLGFEGEELDGPVQEQAVGLLWRPAVTCARMTSASRSWSNARTTVFARPFPETGET